MNTTQLTPPYWGKQHQSRKEFIGLMFLED